MYIEEMTDVRREGAHEQVRVCQFNIDTECGGGGDHHGGGLVYM